MSTMRFARAVHSVNRDSVLRRATHIACFRIPRIDGGLFDTPEDAIESTRSSARYYSSTPSPMIAHRARSRPKTFRAEEMQNHEAERHTRTSKKIRQLKGKVKVLSREVRPRSSRRDERGPSRRETRRTEFKPLRAPFSVFVACLPGLEPSLLEEVEYLQSQWRHFSVGTPTGRGARSVPGGVKLAIPALEHLYLLQMYLGTASHIYLRLNDDGIEGCSPLFCARGFPELQRKLKDLMLSQRWDQLLDLPFPNAKGRREERDVPWELQVHATTSKSKLIHSKAVEERVRETIGDVLGINGFSNNDDSFEEDERATRTNADARDRPVVRLLVRIDRDVVQVSLDASSSDGSAIPLHKRGYRLNPYKAPLREDLAFALSMAGGVKPRWNLRPLRSLFPDGDRGGADPAGADAERGGELRLLDPFCGSGTIAIEGASILAGLPPGRFRPPPLAGTRFCDPKLWDDVGSRAMSASLEPGDGPDRILVAAADVSAGAVDAAKSNARRAGVERFIDFATCPFKYHPLLNPKRQGKGEFEVSGPLLVVANPPYGTRMKTSSQGHLYKKFARALSFSPHKTRCTLIGRQPKQLREMSLPLDVAFSTKQGGLSVVVMTQRGTEEEDEEEEEKEEKEEEEEEEEKEEEEEEEEEEEKEEEEEDEK